MVQRVPRGYTDHGLGTEALRCQEGRPPLGVPGIALGGPRLCLGPSFSVDQLCDLGLAAGSPVYEMGTLVVPPLWVAVRIEGVTTCKALGTGPCGLLKSGGHRVHTGAATQRLIRETHSLGNVDCPLVGPAVTSLTCGPQPASCVLALRGGKHVPPKDRRSRCPCQRSLHRGPTHTHRGGPSLSPVRAPGAHPDSSVPSLLRK